jgi:hypothetical protein
MNRIGDSLLRLPNFSKVMKKLFNSLRELKLKETSRTGWSDFKMKCKDPLELSVLKDHRILIFQLESTLINIHLLSLFLVFRWLGPTVFKKLLKRAKRKNSQSWIDNTRFKRTS